MSDYFVPNRKIPIGETPSGAKVSQELGMCRIIEIVRRIQNQSAVGNEIARHLLSRAGEHLSNHRPNVSAFLSKH